MPSTRCFDEQMRSANKRDWRQAIKNAVKALARSAGIEIQRVAPPPSRLLFAESLPHEHEGLKAFANRTARLLSELPEMDAVRGVYLSGILGPTADASVYTPIEVGGPRTEQLGAWTRERGAPAGTFLRDSRRSDDFLWSSRQRIQPKRGKWRVVFLGESVARGYLYDPQFNPADTLEGLLRTQLGEGKIDVIDLAKSNQTQQELKILIGQSLALEPDILVIFAGNNWRTHISESDIPTVHGLLTQGGVPPMKAFLDQQRGMAALRLTEQINALVAPKKTGVVWIVPEFNLGDWADPVSTAPLLPPPAAREWRSLCDLAEGAQKAGDFVKAEQFAAKLTELDGGTNAIPLRILADCQRQRGDLAATRRYLEGCRDAEGWDPGFSYSPRIASILQNALRQARAFPRNRVVDLPAIFDSHLAGGLPDRKLFLDYCHLSTTGIELAMAATASEIVELLTERRVSPQQVRAVARAPSAAIEGKASFLAGVHNAHFYQSSEVVQYWCDRAVASSPEISEVMVRFIEAQTRRTPMFASRSLLEITKIDRLDTLRYLMHGRERRLDLVLAEAVARAVAGTKPHFATQIADLRTAEHSARSGRRQLIDFYYNSSVVSSSERRWTTSALPTNRGSRNVYTSAFSSLSRFIFCGESQRACCLRLTCRVPHLATPVRLGIAINRAAIGDWPVNKQWRTIEVEVPGNVLSDGMNEVILSWPDEDDCEGAQIERAADMLTRFRLPYFYRVYGEVHSLTIGP